LTTDGQGKIVAKEEKVLDEKCPQCGAPMKQKYGRFGPFIACSKYPDCQYIKKNELDIACPKAGCEGKVIQRRTRKGRVLYGCTKYPKCDFVSWYLPVAEPCPQCSFPVLFEKTTKKKGKVRFCAEKDCEYEVPAAEKETAVTSDS
jgi:DNA topoisomerase-1